MAVFSAALSSVATVLKVQGVQSVPPVLAAAVGVFFGGTIAWCYLIVRRQIPSLDAVRAAAAPLAMLIFCRPICSNLMFSIGLAHTSGIKAVFLTKMEPYLVIFWVWLLDGKRPSGKHLVLLIVHIFGAIMLSKGSAGTDVPGEWGDLIIVTAVVTAALSYRYIPRITKTLTPIQTATIAEFTGGVITLPIALALCPIELGPEQQIGWTYIAVHALMFYVLATTFLYASLGGIEAWLSSALRALGPLIAAPIAWLVFGERLGPVQFAGAVIVLITSALISRAEKKEIIIETE